MTEFEDRDEEYGSAEGEAARALFTHTVSISRPHLGFTADDVVHGGRRAARRRRVVVVLGGTASVAAVALAATALPGIGSGAGTTSPLASIGHSPTAHPSGSTTTATGKPQPDDAQTTAAKRLASAVYTDVLARLDPPGRHLVSPNQPGAQAKYWPSGGTCANHGATTSYDAATFWTADGKNPYPPNDKAAPTKTPYIQISIAIFAAGADDQFANGHWGPVSQSPLPDGSVLRTATASGGHRMQVDRVMSNHEQVVVTLMDGSTIPGNTPHTAMAPATDPFPFTIAQVAASVKDLALPLPFADGFRPHYPEC
jgi:hypothetical protein